MVALADLKIDLVVRRSDLQRAGAERLVDRRIANNRDFRRRPEGATHGFPNPPSVARVLGMHRDGDVTRNRLGPRGLDLDKHPRRIRPLVAHPVDRAVHRLHVHLFVRERCLRDGTPVHHPLAAVDISFAEEINKRREDRLRVVRVHRKLRALPVARGAERAELFENLSAFVVAPGPDSFEKFVATEVAAGFFFGLTELTLDDVLRRDARVVRPR